MATIVRRNERSWAMMLISKINIIARDNGFGFSAWFGCTCRYGIH